MKRPLNMLLVLALLVSCSLWSASLQAQGKKRVAVFAFEDKTDHRYHWWNGQPVGDGMADMITTTLVKSGRYRVMERAQMAQLMQEQGLGMTGAVTPQSAAQAGKMLGVEWAIIGAVTEFGYKKVSTGGMLKKVGVGAKLGKQSSTVAVDVRIVNVSTGEILKADNVRKEKSRADIGLDIPDISFDTEAQFDESLVGKATREAIDGVVKLLDEQGGGGVWEAKVITAKEDQVVINAGSESGTKAGERFTVYRAGEELIDPDTGESLGAEETKVGEIEVVNNNYGGKGKASTCKILSGSGFLQGDMVRKP